jgi:uncharacterized phage protein (TIGR01671 family)
MLTDREDVSVTGNGLILFDIGANAPQERYERVEGFVLMQYTGLEDKRGREIYEGDILRWNWPDEDIFEDYVVSYDSLRAAFIHTLASGRQVTPEVSYFNTGMVEDTDSDEIEVVGNIYKNPELLSKEASE